MPIPRPLLWDIMESLQEALEETPPGWSQPVHFDSLHDRTRAFDVPSPSQQMIFLSSS